MAPRGQNNSVIYNRESKPASYDEIQRKNRFSPKYNESRQLTHSVFIRH